MADRFTRENPIGRLEPLDRGLVVLRTSLVDDATPDVGPGPSDGTIYEENTPVPASPNVQLAAVATSAAARIPSQNTDFRTAYSPCGDGGNMGSVFSDAKETNNEVVAFGHDDKYSTLHWNEDTEEYFWGAEGTNNCYIGKHLGNGSGADLAAGHGNVGIGVNSGFLLKAADYNVWAGSEAFYYATTPVYSVAIGYQSGYYTDDGRGNTFVGALTGYNTSDVTRIGITRQTPVWARVKAFTDTSSPNCQPITEYNGLMVTCRRESGSSKTEVHTSPDGANWTLVDAELLNGGSVSDYEFSTSVHFLGRAWFNLYAPNADGEGYLATWNGVSINESMLYETYSPLSPNNMYCSTLIVYQGMMVGVFTITSGINDDNRAVYWTADGSTWTKCTNYSDLSTTYYNYGNTYSPALDKNYATKTNILIEFGGDLYWICSRIESSLCHTKILKMTSLVFWSVVGDIAPDSNYMHPFAAEVIGDTCYLFIQELGNNGSYSTTNRSLYLYTSMDMVNWTKVKDYGDIGVIHDSVWFERELLIVRGSVAAADSGVHYVDRIDPVTFERTSETTISTNSGTDADSYFLVYNGSLYLGKMDEIHKRTRTTWHTEELSYDLVASYNTFVGIGSGYSNVYGQGNMALGAFSDFTSDSLFNATAIGYRAVVSSSNTIILGGTGTYAVMVGIGKTTCGYTLDVLGTGGFSGQLTITEATLSPLAVSSVVVCTNLNADLLDGNHAAAFSLAAHNHDTAYISIIATPAANKFPYQTAGGELVDSTYNAASFATAAHNHTGTYEPALGNPDVDGKVLSSTAAGVRSWAAPGGGAAAFLDLTDVDEANYTGHAGNYVVVNGAEDKLVFSAAAVAGHAMLSAAHTDSTAAAVVAGDIIYGDDTPKWTRLAHGSDGDVLTLASGLPSWAAPSGGAAHDILSATHGDAAASAVSRGSIIYGNSTPKWAELAVGASGYVLTSDGTDIAWAAPSGGAAHDILSATHGDALAAAVSRGSIIYGNATPKWAELVVGSAGYVLASDGTDVAWALVPAHASRHLSGGADAIKLDDLAAPDNNTDLDVSTSLHGLCPKAPNDTAKFLRGDGTWAAPSGGADPWTYVHLDADFTMDSSAAADITGLYFTPAANKKYHVKWFFAIQPTENATNAGRVGFTYPSGLNTACSWATMATSSSAETNVYSGLAADSDWVIAGSANGASTSGDYPVWGEMIIVTGATPTGNVQARIRSENNTYTVTVRIGSFLAYRLID